MATTGNHHTPHQPGTPAPVTSLQDLVLILVRALDGVAHASIDLTSTPAAPPPQTPAERRGQVLDRYQRDLGDGPTFRAAESGATVHMTLDELDGSWPGLAGAAATAGISSVLAVPLPPPSTQPPSASARTVPGGSGPVGVLTVYCSHDLPLTAVPALLAVTVARPGTAAAAAQAVGDEAERLREQYSEALWWRGPIEQAKGILMAIHSIDAAAAFARLRSTSQNSNTPLRDVAAAFVASASGSTAPASSPPRHPAPPAAVAVTSDDFRGVFARAPTATAITDLGGRLLEVNQALARMLGRQPHELHGDTLLSHTHPEDLATLSGATAGLRTGAVTQTHLPARLLSATGAVHPVTVTTTALPAPNGGPLRLAVHVADRSEQLLTEQLRRETLHDPLTGLPNRSLLTDRATAADEQHHRTGLPVSVLYLDIDRFKAVNDTHGHTVGDAVLITVAERVTAAVRDSDTVARVGGDEFVVLCLDTTADDADALARRLTVTLSTPVDLDGDSYPVTVSVGWATTTGPAGQRRVADLIHAADAAMYATKGLPTTVDVSARTEQEPTQDEHR